MGNAVHKEELEAETVQLDVRDALSAALQRAESVAPSSVVLKMVSSEQWKNMDTLNDNILVFDPE